MSGRVLMVRNAEEDDDEAKPAIITQVVQNPQTVQQLAAKSSLEAAKRRVTKLKVSTSPKSTSPSSDTNSLSPNSIKGTPPTPEPPSPHTTIALSTLQSGQKKQSSIPNLSAKLQKERKSPSLLQLMFPCCSCSATDDTVQLPMTAVSTEKIEGKWLLPPLRPEHVHKKCLVLDLDETLVHSSFKPVPRADFIIPVEIDKTVHSVYVLKRPGVDAFLQRIGPQYEVVVFTASLSKYADPVLDILDQYKVVTHRLFREACIHHKGNYVKDLSLLGRDLKNIIIVDNSPACYMFHPSNAIPISSWFDDPNDTELTELAPFLEDLKLVEDVMLVLDQSLDENYA